MDEPLSNLDAQLRMQTRLELIQLHQRLGITTMYVTHDQVEAMTMGHRIAVMSEGVLQQIGTPQDVYRRPANVFVATFLGAPPMNLIDGALESPRRRLALPRPGRRRAALDRGAQRARAGARDRGAAATSSSACARSTSGSARPGRTAASPAACGSSSLSARISTSRSRPAERPSRCAPTPTRPLQPGDNLTLHFDAVARARLRRGRPQPAPRRAAGAVGRGARPRRARSDGLARGGRRGRRGLARRGCRACSAT